MAVFPMSNQQAFLQRLSEKGKKQDYIDMSKELLDSFYHALGTEPQSSKSIDAFVRDRWSGYVRRDRATFQILNDYADFCETAAPLFTNAFREYTRETFEGEARKAMRAYKNAIVYIPKDTKIDPFYLNGLTNGEFAEAFRRLQELIYAIYDDIERGSPFDWGWPDWSGLTADGINHNRVMMTFEALAGSGHMDGDKLVVDKARFFGYAICKPMARTKLLLEGFVKIGFNIEGFEDKKSSSFIVTYLGIPNLITVLCAYFKKRSVEDGGNRVRAFSYRFVENPAAQTRETFFLAKTDGEPEKRREIYYWLYDEAVKYGFSPMGYVHMGCYSYKKGEQEWLLLGSGSSYHEDDFLHSPDFALAAKALFLRIFQTHPEKIDNLLKRFPESVGRPWDWCFKCRTNSYDCKNRIMLKKDGRNYYHCGAKTYFYFHDPEFDDVKAILELYKLENDIKPL